MPADVTIDPIDEATRPLVERLWQFYRHDLSEFRGLHGPWGVRGTLPAEDGTFNDRGLQPFLADDPGRAAYLFRRDGSPAGFALVQLDEPLMLAEFFVARGARGQGIGRAAALALFERHPGTWEIAFQENNVAAARFWRRLCAEVARDGVVEELRPVPGKPGVPPDVWLTLNAVCGSEPQTRSC